MNRTVERLLLIGYSVKEGDREIKKVICLYEKKEEVSCVMNFGKVLPSYKTGESIDVYA